MIECTDFECPFCKDFHDTPKTVLAPTTIVRNNRTGANQAVVGALPVEALIRTIDQVLCGNR